MVQISSNGELIKDLSSYPKINICSPHISSRHKNVVTHYPCCPISAVQACRIEFSHRIYFWFSFYCACTSFKHKSRYPLRNGKIRCFTIFKMKVCPPPSWPSKSFLLKTCNVYLHNICKRETGTSGERYSISRRRYMVRIKSGKNILKWPWK